MFMLGKYFAAYSYFLERKQNGVKLAHLEVRKYLLKFKSLLKIFISFKK